MDKYFFFDLDGTLTDPGEGITNSVAHALLQFGIEVADRRELYPFIGPPLKDSFLKYYEITDSGRAIAAFREYFATRGILENRVYPEIPAVLASLRASGVHVGLATSKPEPYARQILDRFALTRYFEVISGATMDETLVDKGEILLIAMEKMGLGPGDGRALMIGDRLQDVEGARKAGIPAVGVLWGYGSREELAGAARVVEAPSELLGL